MSVVTVYPPKLSGANYVEDAQGRLLHLDRLSELKRRGVAARLLSTPGQKVSCYFCFWCGVCRAIVMVGFGVFDPVLTVPPVALVLEDHRGDLHFVAPTPYLGLATLA